MVKKSRHHCGRLKFYYIYHTWYFHSLMTSAFWHQNILRHFTWSAPPLLYSWSDSPIRCSAPLYSRSGSLIGSAYYFLYISFCFRFNKSLTNLTSLRQHHFQYTLVPGRRLARNASSQFQFNSYWCRTYKTFFDSHESSVNKLACLLLASLCSLV